MSHKTSLTGNSPLHRVNFCIESASANSIFTKVRHRHAICHFGTSNQNPIIWTGIRQSSSSSYHRHHWSVCIARNCKGSRAVVDRVRTSAILNGAEIPLSSYANTVILIWQLTSRRRVKIVTPYPPAHTRVILQAALISSRDAHAINLGYPDPPQAVEGDSACDHCENYRVTLA